MYISSIYNNITKQSMYVQNTSTECTHIQINLHEQKEKTIYSNHLYIENIVCAVRS